MEWRADSNLAPRKGRPPNIGSSSGALEGEAPVLIVPIGTSKSCVRPCTFLSHDTLQLGHPESPLSRASASRTGCRLRGHALFAELLAGNPCELTAVLLAALHNASSGSDVTVRSFTRTLPEVLARFSERCTCSLAVKHARLKCACSPRARSVASWTSWKFRSCRSRSELLHCAVLSPS